jgi:hypothetical protein
VNINGECSMVNKQYFTIDHSQIKPSFSHKSAAMAVCHSYAFLPAGREMRFHFNQVPATGWWQS